MPAACRSLNPLRCCGLAERMALHNIRVVALPLTNGWLLGRQDFATPLRRPLAPIRQLQRAGVCVAVGGDNVQDPWFPAGNFDPFGFDCSKPGSGPAGSLGALGSFARSQRRPRA
jgi:cytosine deaminase